MPKLLRGIATSAIALVLMTVSLNANNIEESTEYYELEKFLFSENKVTQNIIDINEVQHVWHWYIDFPEIPTDHWRFIAANVLTNNPGVVFASENGNVESGLEQSFAKLDVYLSKHGKLDRFEEHLVLFVVEKSAHKEASKTIRMVLENRIGEERLGVSKILRYRDCVMETITISDTQSTGIVYSEAVPRSPEFQECVWRAHLWKIGFVGAFSTSTELVKRVDEKFYLREGSQKATHLAQIYGLRRDLQRIVSGMSLDEVRDAFAETHDR